jgi:MAF protein
MKTFSEPAPTTTDPQTLVLASSSPYRRALLERLGWPFVTADPGVNEAAEEGENAAMLVTRLAKAKARALASRYPQSVIIGSDQMAVLDGVALGKPGTPERAERQLREASGRRVEFLTGLCVLEAATGASATVCEPYAVHFRELSDAEIHNYVRLEQPLDCAGSFKSEGLGVALFERFEGNDPTALIGLPLIQLTRLLRQFGVDVLNR